jgi:uncharacterized membrane protein
MDRRCRRSDRDRAVNAERLWPRESPRKLRKALQHGDSDDLRRRRGIILFSLLGMASMTATSLLQTGIVKHLPDPPGDAFDSDRVNSSETAYRFGVPDSTFALASLAANIPIAALGGAERTRRQPWIPIFAAAKSALEALTASWYFYQMPTKEKAWCPYCVTAAVANVAIASLTIPEARRAMTCIMERSS